MVVETVILVPLVVIGLMFIAWTISQPAAEGAAHAAARSAARAAAVESDPGAAAAAGESAGLSAIAGTGCERLEIDIDTSGWDSGWVRATATCVPHSSGFERLASADPLVGEWREPVRQHGQAGR